MRKKRETKRFFKDMEANIINKVLHCEWFHPPLVAISIDHSIFWLTKSCQVIKDANTDFVPVVQLDIAI